MKVKLLRKIRKRYSITHYPNGRYFFGDWHEGVITVLTDSHFSYRVTTCSQPKEIAYKALTERLMEWIRKDYQTPRKRRNITSEKLWHKSVAQ